VWQAILDLVKQLSEVMLSSLPHFWRIATDFTSGKLKKVSQRYKMVWAIEADILISQVAPPAPVEAPHKSRPWLSTS
jgi:hypothetical protein